ncbi:MAG: hypothetical protein IKI31_03200 [Treponema sp.]|nr:hypothetical protein [Treponema sp.]
MSLLSKKTTITMLFFAILSCAVFAVEKNEKDWSSITYYNVPIYKVLESKEAYVVIYGKNRVGAGSTIIPKKWAHGNVENPRKLQFRAS